MYSHPAAQEVQSAMPLMAAAADLATVADQSFDKPAVEAKAPSITSRILAYLQDGHSITPLEALANYGCFRLADVIFRLKGRGWVIGTYLKTDPNGKTYARYSMMKRFDKFTVPAEGTYVRTVADLERNGFADGRLVTMFSGLTYRASDELRLVA